MSCLENQNSLLSYWAGTRCELTARERQALEGSAVVVSFAAYELLLTPVDGNGQRTVVVVARDAESARGVLSAEGE
jgi:hypothetical protein